MPDTEYICLDTEFVNNITIIELSVYSIAGREIYHRLFRPSRKLKWTAPPDKLKITPEMVAGEPTFRERLEEIQPMFDRARYIIGYAVDNDIKMLAREGVKGLDSKEVLEVRNLYWLVRGRRNGVDLYGVPNLIAISRELGLTFDEGEAHFASADTRATLGCFHSLMHELCCSAGVVYDRSNPDLAISLFRELFDEAKKEYDRQQAHGFLSLFQTEKGYKYKLSKFRPDRETVLCVEVADRSQAEYDVMKLIGRREIPGFRGYFKLRQSDIEKLRAYTNAYDDTESETMRKLMKFKGRLSF